jgi:hypothetical protein
MKTIIIGLFVTILCVAQGVAQERFSVLPKVKAEYYTGPQDAAMMIFMDSKGACVGQINPGNILTSVGVSLRYIGFNLDFDGEVYMKSIPGRLRFGPNQGNYYVNLGYTLKGKYKLYVETACFHPVSASWRGVDTGIYQYRGGYTKVGISFNY